MFPSFSPISPTEIKNNIKDGYSEINQHQAYQLMQEENTIILDVRTKEEFLTGYIPNAINLPVEDITNTTKLDNTNSDTLVLIYCRSGRRAIEAGHKLVESGYKKVANFGGILTWKYDVVY